MSAIPDARRLFAALRLMRFTIDYDTTAGGGRLVQWSRTYRKRPGDPWRRHVEVQLYDDGKHRASHFLGGSMDTPPSEFSRLDQLADTVMKELTRKDHPRIAVTDYRPARPSAGSSEKP